MAYNKLRIAKIIQETPDARSFVLEVPADLAEKYRYRAGQFLTFQVSHPDRPSVIFDAEFEALVKANPGRLEIVHHLDAVQGITKPEEIVAAMKGFEMAEAYLCGPGPFMSLVEETLFEHGMPHDRVRIERFEASGNDAIPIEPSEEGDLIPDHITIRFQRKRH